ncbi:MAG: efflux RND transporter periplasmic adaptor subunit [Burkholderiaceae bacterium]
MKLSVVIAAVAAGVLIAGGGAWFVKRSANAAATSSAPAAPAIKPLELNAADITQVQLTELKRVLNSTGTLNATQQTVVKAKASGDLIAVLVKEGEVVTRGQVLARIDSADYAARVAAARANVEQAKANLAIGERAWTNNKALVEKGFISSSAMDNTESQAAALRAQLAAAQAQLAREQKALEDTVVRAPLAGVVTERFVQAGEKVSPDARLMTVVDPHSLEFEAAVPAADAALLTQGMQLAIVPDGTAAFESKVLRVNAAVTAANRTVDVFASVPQNAKVKSGQFASATVRLADKAQAITVPANALREEGGRTVIYTLATKNGAEFIAPVQVTPGGKGENASGEPVVEVAGVTTGTRIIGRNLGPLRDGAVVKVLAAKPATAASN